MNMAGRRFGGASHNRYMGLGTAAPLTPGTGNTTDIKFAVTAPKVKLPGLDQAIGKLNAMNTALTELQARMTGIANKAYTVKVNTCLLYTSPSPRDS